MKRFAKLSLVVLILMTGFALVRGTAPQVATGTWQSGSDMNEARTGAAAVTLDDGRVLVFGGTTSSGGATNAVQVFSDGSWSDLGAVMLDARSGHSATALADGRILIAGGENSSGPLSSMEVYDPSSGEFSSASTLSAGRKAHGAARLPGGSVLMIGGSDGTNALATSEIYDPESGSVSAGPSLSAPRSGLSVTRLLDGKMLIAGGNNGEADLASTLIYDAADGSFTAGADLSAPRSGHSAVLLPNNNSVLISGGSGSASAELYVPWTGSVSSTSAMSSARDGAAGSGSGWDGVALVAGGGSASSELYGFATVKTDQEDYAPTQTVTVTGSGWQPGETVNLLFHEVLDTPFHEDHTATVVADASGSIYNSEYVLEEHDIGVRYYLIATSVSTTAQTTFTDGTPRITNVSVSPFSPNQASSVGVKDTTVITGRNQGSGTIADFRIRIHAGTASGLLVREFLQASVPQNTNTTATWNGKDSSNAFVADGTYIAVASNITAENTAANDIGTIVVDNANPAAPSTPDLHQGSDSGTSNADNITNETTPRFDGTAEANSTVEVFADSTSIGTGTAGGGSWSVNNAGPLTDGTYLITAKATDTAGNVSPASGSLSVTIDTIAPNTSIDSNPSNPSGSTSASFTFSGTDADSVLTFECKLDAAAFAPCTSPQNYGGLAATSHTFQVRATDRAGNTDATPASFTWSIVTDGTAPVVTISFSAPDGSNGWHVTSPVLGTVSADDSTTGNSNITAISCLDGATPLAVTGATGIGTPSASGNLSVSGEGTHNISCTASDGTNTGASAGSTIMPVEVKIDTVEPSLSATRLTAANANGWNNTDVSVRLACTDATSLVASINATGDASGSSSTSPLDVTVTTEGAGQSVNGSCEDNAGNDADPAGVSDINIDKTDPVVTASGDPAPNANGWNKTDVTVSYTCDTDTGSGIDNAASDLGDDILTASGSASGTCVDLAGNSDSDTYNALIDKLAPNAPTGHKTPAATSFGWNNTDVEVSFTDNGDNGDSGIDFCTDPSTLTAETSGTDVNGTCTDKAGNVSDTTTVTVKIDKTNPVIAGSRAPLANSYGWNNTDVVVSFACTDTAGSANSGVDTNTVAGATVSAEGAGQSVTNSGTCTDKADNTAASATVSDINIDKTNPTINASISPLNPAVSGWYNIATGRPTVTFSCGDALSGVDDNGCAPAVGPMADGADQTASGSVMDKAGNSASASITNIDVDATAPSVTITTPPNGTTYTINQLVAADYACSDSTSLIATCAGPVADGANIDTTIGSHTFLVSASDNAGNTNSATTNYGVTYSVCVLYDQSKAHKKGSTVPVKLYLCDANGADVSSASTVVTATNVVKVDNSAGALDDSGQANSPDFNFRFDLSLGPSGGYIFNLSTKPLSTGTWRLYFTVTGEPPLTTHYVTFDVK